MNSTGNSNRRRYRSLGAALALAGAALNGPAHAHEGHEHLPPEPARETAAAPAPRLALASPRLELVALRQGGDVLIYLDDFATNAPLPGLQVEVRSGSRVLQAAEGDDGVYRLPGDLLDARRPLQLAFAVRGMGIDEVLQGVLPAAPDATAAHADAAWRRQWLWPAVPMAALGMAAWVLRRRRLRRSAAPRLVARPTP